MKHWEIFWWKINMNEYSIDGRQIKSSIFFRPNQSYQFNFRFEVINNENWRDPKRKKFNCSSVGIPKSWMSLETFEVYSMCTLNHSSFLMSEWATFIVHWFIGSERDTSANLCYVCIPAMRCRRNDFTISLYRRKCYFHSRQCKCEVQRLTV